jgi:glycosyltransferase involved in cell wall biosynthesis
VTSQPEIAVVVAAYNAESTIVQAVESLFSGTMECCVYVVDDHSQNPVANYLGHLSSDRLIIHRLDENLGPATARNVALRQILDAGYKYVAIMDADDISMPDRLAKQFAFMESHPEVGACGTWVREFYHHPGEQIKIHQRPPDPDGVRKLMYFNIGISHASAMIRVEALRRLGLYCSAYPVAEDYELLRRIATRYQIANIPECLVHYRISPGGQSLRRRRRQLFDRFLIQLKYFEFTQWRAWAGVLQTIVTLALPLPVFRAVKARLR